MHMVNSTMVTMRYDYISTKLVSSPYPKSQIIIRCEIVSIRIRTKGGKIALVPAHLIQTGTDGLCPVADHAKHSTGVQIREVFQ